MLLIGVCPTPSHFFTRLNNLPSLSLFSQGGHLQNMFQFISVFLALAHPKLGAVFEVQSDESWVEGENSFPQPNRYTPVNTLHGVVGLLVYQSMLLTLVLLATTTTPIPAKVRPRQNFTSLYSCKYFFLPSFRTCWISWGSSQSLPAPCQGLSERYPCPGACQGCWSLLLFSSTET